MRNSEHYITTTGSEPLATDDETTWSFPGAIIGFVSWLLALGIPFLIYGGKTLGVCRDAWPGCLALMPVAVVVGIALHSLLNGKLLYSTVVTIVTVVLMFGLLFLWLMG